jgi:hypothetical protein
MLIALALLLDFMTEEFPLDVGGFRYHPAGFAVLTGVLSLAYPAVGALIASRLPVNPIGWIFCAEGLLFATQRFMAAYADYVLLEVLTNIRSAARSLLPNATETKIMFTANARALRHFLEMRGGIVGDEEMRRYAAALLECLQVEAPAPFSDFKRDALLDGTLIVRKVELPAELLV